MQVWRRVLAKRALFSWLAQGLCVLGTGLLGCASPGAPKAPSLQLPREVRDLSAERSGNQVLLHFSVSDETTEGVPLHSHELRGRVCRQEAPQAACKPLLLPEAEKTLPVPRAGATARVVTWADPLPPELLAGEPRILAYRLELSNENGHSGGYSTPAFAAAGTAPSEVRELRALGVRAGILLEWAPASGTAEVIVERQQVGLSENKPGEETHRTARDPLRPLASTRARADKGTLWLQADPGNAAAVKTIDGGVAEGVAYRYTAVRRLLAQVNGRNLELRSEPSVPVEITWRDVYPPSAPLGLTAVGFKVPQGAEPTQKSSFAVDIIWKPLDDPRVVGYIVQRVGQSQNGQLSLAAVRLTAQPVTVPAFHDATAYANVTYRYEVIAVDGKGNASLPASFELKATEP